METWDEKLDSRVVSGASWCKVSSCCLTSLIKNQDTARACTKQRVGFKKCISIESSEFKHPLKTSFCSKPKT